MVGRCGASKGMAASAHETAPLIRRRPSPQAPDRRRREPGSRKRALLRGEPRAAFVRVGRHALRDRAGRISELGWCAPSSAGRGNDEGQRRFSVFSGGSCRSPASRMSRPRKSFAKAVWRKKFSSSSQMMRISPSWCSARPSTQKDLGRWLPLLPRAGWRVDSRCPSPSCRVSFRSDEIKALA